MEPKTKRPRGSMYNTIVRALLWVTVIVFPLFYLPWTSGIIELNKQLLLVVVAALGLVLWLLGVVVSGKLIVRSTPVDKGVWAIFFATLIATIFSIARTTSIFGMSGSSSSSLLTISALTVLYFLAVNTFHDRGRVLRSALSLSAVLALGAALAQMVGLYILPGAFTHTRAFSTVGSLNVAGVIAAVCLALFAKTLSRKSGWFDFMVALVGLAASLVVLALLNWWVLWVATLVGMLAMTAFDSMNATQLAQDYGGPARGRFSLGRFVIPMVVVVIGGFLLLVHFNPASLKSHFPAEISPSYRLSGHIAKEVLSHKPFTGYGPENFSIAFDAFGAQHIAGTQWMSTTFFDSIAEIFTMAVHGGILLLLAVLITLWALVQVIGRFVSTISETIARGDGAVFAVQSCGTLAAVIAMVASLCLSPFNSTLYFIWYILLALAALMTTEGKAKTVDIESRPWYSLGASLGFVAGLILVLTGAYFFTTRYLADAQYAHAVTSTGVDTAVTGLNRAISLTPNNSQYLRDASQVALVQLQQEVNTPAKPNDPQRAQRIQNDISRAVQFAQRATVVAPLESANWSNLGQVYASLGGLVDSIEQLSEDAFTHAATLRPGDPTFDNRIGSVWLARADRIRAVNGKLDDSLTRAATAFQRALTTSPDFGLAIYNLGAVYERQGRITDAIGQLERLAPYNANDTTLIFQLALLYIRAGQKANAIAALQRVVLLAPQYANAHWYLALLYEDKGDLVSELAELQTIQPANKDNQVLNDKIAALQAGQRAIPPAKVIDSKPLQ